jgi:hypothetical protein
VWAFRVGAHQVCRKWLRDRRGRRLSHVDLTHFTRILIAIDRTLEIMRDIDDAVVSAGGWPAAFRGRDGGRRTTDDLNRRQRR